MSGDRRPKPKDGKRKAAFRNVTLIADNDGGPEDETTATCSMKAWAADQDEEADMVIIIGRHVCFKASCDIPLHPAKPPAPLSSASPPARGTRP